MSGDEREMSGAFGPTWRDGLIALLLILFVALSGWTVLGREGGRDARRGEIVPDVEEEAVSVFDVIADRDERKTIEILFDRPAVDPERVGKVLARPPVTLSPAVPGVWRWSSDSLLRFEASGRIPQASELTLALIPERIAGEGRELAGRVEFEVVFDRFLVEEVRAEEEMAVEGDGRVVLTGWIRFNYSVDPDLLAPRLRLRDPDGVGDSPPEILLESSWPQPSLSFRTGPIVKTPEPRTLQLVIAGDLTSEEGNAPLGRDHEAALPVGGSSRLEVREVEPRPGLSRSTLDLTFSSPVSADLAAPYVRVEPEVDYRLRAERNVLTLEGGFAPGSRYQLEIAEGLPAADEAVLRQTVRRQVTFADLPAAVSFAARGTFLSRSGYRNLQIDTVNVDDLRLVIDRVYANNLLFLFQQGGFESDYGWVGGELWRPLGDRIVDRRFPVRSLRNQKVTTVLSLDRFADLDAPGLYRVMLGRPDHWEAPQRWILATDLGAVAKRSDDGLLIWALSSRDLRPATGAEIEVISDQNQSLARGRTDGEGFWRWRDPGNDEDGRPFLVTVRRGEDFSFLYLDRMRVDTSGLDVSGAMTPAAGYTAFLYGERDLYRPGETLRGVAMVRDRDLRPAPSMPVLLRHRSPDGRELSTRRATIDSRGLLDLEVPLSEVSPTGGHSLELEIAEEQVGFYRFQVEEFVPDRIAVEVFPNRQAVASGEQLEARVEARYLFGAPASGLAAETRIRLEDSTFTSEAHPGFSFRDSQRSFAGREVYSETARLSEEGTLELAVELPRERVPSSLQAVVTARVQEAGGRGVTSRLGLPVHPVPYYVGLRRIGDGYPEPGQEVEFEFAAVEPGGGERAPGELVAELVLERWQTVLRSTPSGNYRYESVRQPVLVASRRIAGGEPRGRFRFTPDEYGRHRVVIRDPATGAASDVDFYVSGWGYSAWAIDNPARLELDLDREEYAAGDTAVIQVRAPFAGKLLLTVERDRVFDRSVHLLEGNTATLRLPIRDFYGPNAYITATLVRGVTDLEPGGAARAFGAVPLPVERVSNRIDLEIEAPEELRSSSPLEVVVRAAPGAAVTVAAVDEGILQLVAQKTPDPFGFFYRKLALSVDTFDTFSLLLPEIEAAEAGGGLAEARSQYVRTEGIRRVRPVSFWSGVLEADGRGEARVSFDLPDFQGALRLMAVTADGARFGSGRRLVRVRDPLVLTPTLPRVLSFGERLEVPVVLRNDSGKDGRFELSLGVKGAASVEGPATAEVEIPDGRQATHYFVVETGASAGAAAFSFSARGNGERATASVEIAVRPDLSPVTTAVSGSLQDRTLVLPAADESAFRDGAERRLIVGSFPLVRFDGRLEELLRYPYGCLEQTVSKAFPLIYLGDLADQLGQELGDRESATPDPGELVGEAVRRIALQRLPGGGFGLWPGSRRPDPWTSVYAVHFLVEADRSGYPVDSALLDAGLAGLAEGVRARESYGSNELERMVYALYVLARAGRADLGTMDFLRDKQASGLRPESRGFLAAAYASVGHRDAVGELLARVGEVDRVERQTGENLRSTLRSRAMLLLAYLDAAPGSDRIPELAERLVREASAQSGWTTQEGAFTFLALGQLANRQGKRGEYSGQLWAGDRLVGRFGSESTAEFSGLPPAEELRIELEPGYQPGGAFFHLETRGIPSDQAYRPAADGLEIERRFWSRDHRPLDLERLRQGDLVVIETRVRSTTGPVENVAIANLLPSGLEVENPRLETTEELPWITGQGAPPDHLDLRDDRILIFTGLENVSWRRYFSLARAVSPGTFRLPPAHAEAMYDPARRASGKRGFVTVEKAVP